MTSFTVELEGNAEELARVLRDYGEEIFDTAKTRAINKTMEQGRTQIRREVSRAVGVPIKLLNRRIRLHRANKRRSEARLFIGTVPVAVAEGEKYQKFNRLKTGVSYRGPGGRVRRKDAFVATMPSGHTGVFTRRGKARTPIDKVSISISAAARRAAHMYMNNVVPQKFPQLLDHELRFRTKRAFERIY